MRKLIAILFTFASLTVIGCKTTKAGDARQPYSVDLRTLLVVELGKGDAPGEPTGGTVKNVTPLLEAMDDVFILFPEFPIDVTQYTRLTIRAKYYDALGKEIKQGGSNVMVTLVYDIHEDKRGPKDMPGPNTPVKEFDVGSGQISTNSGVGIKLAHAPGAVLFQSVNDKIKFIEVTGIIFHD